MMVHMVRARAGPPAPAVLRSWVYGRGNSPRQPFTRAIQTRSIATNTAIQEPSTQYPAGVPPVPAPQRSKLLERKEAIKNAKPFSDFLTDTFNRQHDYLRISITERCNLRCLYCMPEEGIPLSPSANMLTTPEIVYLSSLFVSQGVTKIRLTGGEPTVRRDIVPLMQQIGNLRPKGLRELALTTNGIALHRKLDAMIEAGLTGINLSLDTLDPFQFQIMTRRKGFDAVMKSIDRILEMNKLGANVKLKVNCVVMRGLNEREIIPFVEMGREKDIEVRFIEYMPFGGNKWSEGKMISFQEMLDIIRTKYPGLRRVPGHKNDTSKTFEVPGFVGKVGFITSMTNDFCASCNRLRITSDGNIKVCLHGNAEVSLRDLLRQGNGGEPIDEEAFERIRQRELDRHHGHLSDETTLGWGDRERELLETIGVAVKKKAEKHADLNDLASMENRPMILIDRNIISTASTPSRHASRYLFEDSQHNPFNRSRPSISLRPFPLPFIPKPPLSTSPRAFSTTAPSTAEDTSKHSNVYIQGLTPEARESCRLLKDVARDGISNAPLPEEMLFIRRKYKMDTPQFDAYWELAAQAQTTKRKRDMDIAVKQAHYRLRLIEGAKIKQGYSMPEYKAKLPSHSKLMKKVHYRFKKILMERYGKGNADETVEPGSRKLESGSPILKDMHRQVPEFLSSITKPYQNTQAFKEMEEKIRVLETHIVDLKNSATAVDPVEWKDYKKNESVFLRGLKAGDKRQTKRARWRERKELATIAAENEKLGEDVKQGREYLEKALAVLGERLKKYKGTLESAKAVWTEEDKLLQGVRKQKEEMLMKREKLMRLAEEIKIQKEMQKAQKMLYRPNLFQSRSSAIGDVLDVALDQDRRKERVAGMKNPTSLAKAPVLDHAGELKAVVSPHAGTRTATSDGLAALMAELRHSDKVRMGRELKSPDNVTRKVSAMGTRDFDKTFEKFGSTNQGTHQTPASPPRTPKPNDTLRIRVAPSGLIQIDTDFTADLGAPIPSLQSQILVLKDRLKSSYPRIDTLPYDVWHSNNQRTLQTWLKILATRWQTRFNDVAPGTGGRTATTILNDQVKAVLDQMVKDHDLNNEAAKKMAKKWSEIFDQRGSMAGDAEGILDWDEFCAGGMSFLMEGDGEGNVEKEHRQKAFAAVPPAEPHYPPPPHGKFEPFRPQPVTPRRQYSTSSRPPLDPKLAPATTSTPASASTRDTLPHLTSSGSAHMVSVSDKPHTTRTAIAVGTVHFSNPTPLSLIRSNSLKKGDVLAVSRIAGIMAAKKCPDLIPLCHPIALTHVGVELRDFDGVEGGVGNEGQFGGVHIEAKVQCTGPTGVEMEALTAVMGAALSVVDMCKAVDKSQRVGEVRVVLKEGGRSGVWREENWKSLEERY